MWYDVLRQEDKGFDKKKRRHEFMMQKIQRFGGAMFTPVLLFAFSGIMVGLCTVFQSEMIVGSIAAPDTGWYQFWYVIKEGAWTLFRQVPLLFVIALPIGLAKKQNARACMEAFVLYLTFNYMLAAMLTNWGSSFGVDFSVEAASGTGLASIASIKTLDTGMIGALAIAGIVVFLHNRYFDTELPEWLGVFKGSSFICLIGFFVMIPVAFLFMAIWPRIQGLIAGMQSFFISSGALGIWVYTFCERILIPTGLHHFIYMPMAYESIVVEGGFKAAWALGLPEFAKSTESLSTLFPAGGFALYGHSKVFAPIGIGAAFYVTAKPNKKKEVLGLMLPVALTAAFAGITEPIEFTFLFIAPVLFFVHALLAATLAMVEFMAGVSGEFSSGLINWAALNWLPLGATHGMTYVIQVVIGLVFSGIWFIVFRFMILKMNLATPGREDDDEEVKLVSKKEYKAAKAAGAMDEDTSNDPKEDVKVEGGNAAKAAAFLEALGGKDNIEDVTNCATRLRVTVKDDSIIAPLAVFKKAGAHGLVHKGKALQVIVGLSVPSVREEFENLLK